MNGKRLLLFERGFVVTINDIGDIDITKEHKHIKTINMNKISKKFLDVGYGIYNTILNRYENFKNNYEAIHLESQCDECKNMRVVDHEVIVSEKDENYMVHIELLNYCDGKSADIAVEIFKLDVPRRKKYLIIDTAFDIEFMEYRSPEEDVIAKKMYDEMVAENTARGIAPPRKINTNKALDEDIIEQLLNGSDYEKGPVDITLPNGEIATAIPISKENADKLFGKMMMDILYGNGSEIDDIIEDQDDDDDDDDDDDGYIDDLDWE